MNKKVKLGVVMDPIHTISFKKDSTLAMLLEAEERHWPLYYFEQKDLFLRNGEAFGFARPLHVFQDPDHWFELGPLEECVLSELDIILMRKDPPFNMEYIYTTYILEKAEEAGVLVANKPQSLRDANEKIVTLKFPHCCPPTLVTRDITLLQAFFKTHQDIICKPLDSMGGSSVFRLRPGDQNASVIFELLTHRETTYMMAQQFIPAITKGDKRILLIDGTPVPFALARIPAEGELRGNLVAGAKGVAVPLSDRDLFICNAVSPFLREKGVLFAGLDVIGDFLTEINVTSPTCIRELDQQCHLNISAIFCDALQNHLPKKP